MVSVEFEGDYPQLRQNTGSEQSRNAVLRGVRLPVFWLGTSKSDSDRCSDFLGAGEKQSLLDSLLLAQWEDRALKGLPRYDVTSCETKVINGRKNFVALLNENWNVNAFNEYENEIQQSGCQKLNYVKSDLGELLFCIAIGDKEGSQGTEIVSSAMVPRDGIFFVVNTNPIEYGHILMVSCNVYFPPNAISKKALELITQISAEIGNSSFHAFYDHLPSNSYKYFQACYFPNPLAVEVMPLIPLFGEEKGMQIFQLADYPIKALVFISKKLNSVIETVSEICSHLRKQGTPFNLLIAECGSKIFLFPQVLVPDRRNLTAWECGGLFIFVDLPSFNGAGEEQILKDLAAFSLGDEAFKALKKRCCDVAGKSKQL